MNQHKSTYNYATLNRDYLQPTIESKQITYVDNGYLDDPHGIITFNAEKGYNDLLTKAAYLPPMLRFDNLLNRGRFEEYSVAVNQRTAMIKK